MRRRLTAIGAVYFTYYACVGLTVPWLLPFAESRGLGGVEQGVVYALRTASSLVAIPLFGLIADARGVGRALRLSGAIALVSALLLLACHGMLAFAAVFALMGFGGSSFSPLVDAALLSTLEHGEGAQGGSDVRSFGRVRLAGSFGFAAAALGFGLVLRGAAESWTATTAMASVAAFATIALALSFTVPARIGAHVARPSWRDAAALWKRPGVPAVLATGTLQWICMTPYNGFFGEHVEHHGGDARIVGASLATAVAVEVLVMATASRWLPRFSCRAVLCASAAAGVLRWTVTALASPGWIVVAQSLHGLGYAAFWLAMVDAITRRTPPSLRASAQAMIFTIPVGLGTLIGTLAGGPLYAIDQGRTLFLAAGVFSIAPALCALTVGDRGIIT